MSNTQPNPSPAGEEHVAPVPSDERSPSTAKSTAKKKTSPTSKGRAPSGPTRKRKTSSKRLEDARVRMYQSLIIESAEFVFGQNGFENATMQEIASEAGVSLKTVYASFPGKQDLYNEIMLARGRGMFDAVEAAHTAASGPVEKLVEGTRAFVGFLFEHQDWSRIHIRSQTSWAIKPTSERAGALWEDGQRAHEKMFQEGIEAGLFLADDVSEMALMTRAMTRVQVVNAFEAGEKDVNAIADRLINRLLRMFCVDGVDAVKNAPGVK